MEDREREADPIDEASRVEQQYIAERIAANSHVSGPKPTGYCLDPYCDEQLVPDDQLDDLPPDAPRFCGPECRDNWQHEQDRMKRKGYLHG